MLKRNLQVSKFYVNINMKIVAGIWQQKIDEDSVIQGLAAPVSNGIWTIRGKNLTDPRTYRRWMTWALCFLETSESD
jgi:hypothetical protein